VPDPGADGRADHGSVVGANGHANHGADAGADPADH
jgi:hypothetical protein